MTAEGGQKECRLGWLLELERDCGEGEGAEGGPLPLAPVLDSP